MKIINKPLLREFAALPWCERCLGPGPCQAHHIFGKGMGGGRRFDIPINLIGLCVECHVAFHNGRIDREELLAIVARREHTTPEAIQEEIWRLRREG